MLLEGKLPELSPRLGELTRTNSESLLAAVVPHDASHPDFSRGVAITSSFYPEPGTHVEPVSYGHGSNMMGLFGTILVEDGESKAGHAGHADHAGHAAVTGPSWRGLLSAAARQPRPFLRALDLRAWSERTVIALVMQAHDNSLTISAKRGPLGRTKLVSRQGHGDPNPTWLPVGHDVVRRLAGIVGGNPGGTWGEIFGMPMTAHFLGGCVIGASVSEGVIDPWHRVYFVPGLARRGRLGHAGQPGGQPGPDDHGPGGAGVFVLAQQG